MPSLDPCKDGSGHDRVAPPSDVQAHPAPFTSSRIFTHTPLLSPERASLCESSLATSRLAQDLRAAGANDDSLCVRENSRDGETAGALDIHEEGSWAGHEHLGILLVTGRALTRVCDGVYLQLVLASLGLRRWVEEVDGENLRCECQHALQ